jgi:OmpA-OmpF porin, OOP family
MARPILATLLSGIVVVAGCAETPIADPRVVDLSNAINSARANPQISRNAPIPLQEAQQAITQAAAADREGDRPALDHDLSMAQLRLDTARTRAQAQALRDQAQTVAQQSQLQASELKAAQLEQELHARQTPQGTVLTLADVLYESGKAILRPGAVNRLQPLANYLKAHPQVSATIEGFTDSRGSPEHNQQLSQARAQTVKEFLVGEGIDPGRIIARGKGEDYPIASNNTAAGRQQNRRVEVLLSELPQ